MVVEPYGAKPVVACGAMCHRGGGRLASNGRARRSPEHRTRKDRVAGGKPSRDPAYRKCGRGARGKGSLCYGDQTSRSTFTPVPSMTLYK